MTYINPAAKALLEFMQSKGMECSSATLDGSADILFQHPITKLTVLIEEGHDDAGAFTRTTYMGIVPHGLGQMFRQEGREARLLKALQHLQFHWSALEANTALPPTKPTPPASSEIPASLIEMALRQFLKDKGLQDCVDPERAAREIRFMHPVSHLCVHITETLGGSSTKLAYSGQHECLSFKHHRRPDRLRLVLQYLQTYWTLIEASNETYQKKHQPPEELSTLTQDLCAALDDSTAAWVTEDGPRITLTLRAYDRSQMQHLLKALLAPFEQHAEKTS